MDNSGKAGISISGKAFAASFIILFALMMAAGVLTALVPQGSFERIESGSERLIVPGSYRETQRIPYPFWRWLTAPAEVLGTSDAGMAALIIIFIAAVGGAFAVLQRAGVLEGAVSSLADKFRSRKYLLLAIITLFFMSIGSLMGIFEETIPLVPVAIALSLSLGWDVMTGMGMSILATGFGFSAAISNPFSIGTAQKLSGLPLFSGAAFRVIVFVVVYAAYLLWLHRLARKAEAKGAGNLGSGTIGMAGRIPAGSGAAETAKGGPSSGAGSRELRARGVAVFGISGLVLIVLVMLISLTGFLANYSMLLIALVFLGAGFGSGAAAGLSLRKALKAFGEGVVGIGPGIILILMALGVKRIIVAGGIMDTILYNAGNAVAGSTGYAAAALVYVFTLGMNFFIGSATAKAFLLMPILAPLADLTGLSRQIVVQAFAFGDGFSNMLYPTNAVLLIALGVSGISWPAWFRKTWRLQVGTLVITMALLMLSVAIGYR